MKNIVPIFKVLGDEVRVRILTLLSDGELCVCDIEAVLNMSQPRISHHLAKLKQVQLIEDRQEGKWKYYSISDTGKQVLQSSIAAVIEDFKKGTIGKKDSQKLKKRKQTKKC